MAGLYDPELMKDFVRACCSVRFDDDSDNDVEDVDGGIASGE